MPKGVYVRTLETRKKMSDAKKGKNSPRGMLGKYHSETTKKKISNANKGKNNPRGMLGKYHSEKTKQKMRDNHADLSGENHPMFGKKHSEEAKQKISETHKGKKLSEEHKQKIKDNIPDRIGENNPFYGKCHSEEVKQKISNANKGKNHPNWNPNRAEVYAPYGENFYNSNIRNRKWNFQNGRDMITGTKLSPDKQSAYHHIDYDKSNDDPDNHCFLSSNNHMKITSNQRNPIKSERYKKILQENTLALKNGEIPKYWSQINKELFRQEKLKQLDLSSYII